MSWIIEENGGRLIFLLANLDTPKKAAFNFMYCILGVYFLLFIQLMTTIGWRRAESHPLEEN